MYRTENGRTCSVVDIASYSLPLILLSALQVDTAWNAGLREKARENSSAAQCWGIISIITGTAITVGAALGTYFSLANLD